MRKNGKGSSMNKARHTPCVSGFLKQAVQREVNRQLKDKQQRKKMMKCIDTTVPDYSLKAR